MTKPDFPKARPILQTLQAAGIFFAAIVWIAAGSAGVPVHIPAPAVALLGFVFLFPAISSAWLAWQHWRLMLALRRLASAEKAGRGPF